MKFIKIPTDQKKEDGTPVFMLQFFCPACKKRHNLNNMWEFNDDYDKPTVHPSVLVTCKLFNDGDIIETKCHSTITDGEITFCGDCTHDMSNQKHLLIDIEPE